MADVLGGFQPDTKSPSSRRADCDLQRRIAALEAATVSDAEDPDAAWTPLTLESGWTALSGEVPGYRKIGDVVYLRGSAMLTGTYGSSGASLATLPAGFRPGLTYLRMVLPALKAGLGGCYLIRAHMARADGVLALNEYTNPDQSNPQTTLDGISFSVTP